MKTTTSINLLQKKYLYSVTSNQKWVFVPYVSRRYQFVDVTWISFRFVLICCADSSQLRNIFVFTHSHSHCNAATRSATRKYGALPEWSGRNEEQDSINVSKWCAVRPDENFGMKPWIPSVISLFLLKLIVVFIYGKTVDFLIVINDCNKYCVGGERNSWMFTSEH